MRLPKQPAELVQEKPGMAAALRALMLDQRPADERDVPKLSRFPMTKAASIAIEYNRMYAK